MGVDQKKDVLELSVLQDYVFLLDFLTGVNLGLIRLAWSFPVYALFSGTK